MDPQINLFQAEKKVESTSAKENVKETSQEDKLVAPSEPVSICVNIFNQSVSEKHFYSLSLFTHTKILRT
jgi:hypothetical protein